MLVKELAVELAPFGIRVNAISPGAINTASDVVVAGQPRPNRTADLIPLRRLGTAEDIAQQAVLLLNDRISSYITGANLRVDGGLALYNWLLELHGSAANERKL